MKTVRVNGENVSILMNERNFDRIAYDATTGAYGWEPVRVTQVLLVGGNNQLKGNGLAIASPKDHLKPLKARQLALRRALRRANIRDEQAAPFYKLLNEAELGSLR